MVHCSPYRVVPPRRKAPLVAKRITPKPQTREVEHRVWGVGNLLHVRPLDDGSLVAVVEFNGVDRTIRLAPAFWVTPIPDIMKLAPHLAPPAKPKPVKTKTVPDEVEEEREPELGEEIAEATEEDGEEVSDLETV